MNIYLKIIFIFSPTFLAFKNDFIRCFDFTRIAASNTTSDDVTNKVTSRIFNINLSHSCAHFILKTDEKRRRIGGF